MTVVLPTCEHWKFEVEHPFPSEIVLLWIEVTLKKKLKASEPGSVPMVAPLPFVAAIGASVALRFADSRRIPIAPHSSLSLSLSQILFPISQLRI